MPTPALYRPELEQVSDDEAKTIAGLCDVIQSILDTTYQDYGYPVRGVHAKSHAILQGEVTVRDGLPDYLAQGIFEFPKRYCAILRFSTIPSDILDDHISTPRGLAIKIFDVEGERLPGSENAKTQDFVMVNLPPFNVPSPQAFLEGLKMLGATTNRVHGLKKALSMVLQTVESGLEKVGYRSPALMGLGGQQKTSVVGESFFTQVPILYGPYMAKLRVVPDSAALKAKTSKKLESSNSPNALRDDAVHFFAHHGGQWLLQVQLSTDPQKMPIEDASIEWDEQESPYITVATINVDPQPAWNEARVQRVDAQMAFSPWHGITAHRPLGSIMRVRKPVYELSANFRSCHNRQPVSEPCCPFHF